LREAAVLPRRGAAGSGPVLQDVSVRIAGPGGDPGQEDVCRWAQQDEVVEVLAVPDIPVTRTFGML